MLQIFVNVVNVSITKYSWNSQNKIVGVDESNSKNDINYTCYFVASNFFNKLFFSNVLSLDLVRLN